MITRSVITRSIFRYIRQPEHRLLHRSFSNTAGLRASNVRNPSQIELDEAIAYFRKAGKRRTWAGTILGIQSLIVLYYIFPFQSIFSSGDDAVEDGVRYASADQMQTAYQELRSLLKQTVTEGSGETYQEMFSRMPHDLESHSYSEWSTSNSDVKPFAIIYPQTTQQVSLIAKVCTKHRVPMVPYGAGSSVEGSFSSPHSGFCIDFSRMDRILALHEDDMDVVVQPGVNITNLNDKLQPSGLFLPLDPSPTALIGGMISTNCSGTNAMRYGTMKDYVINLTVVLADGSVIKTRGDGRPRKTSAGYDLSRLIAGSEGTLGIITEATVKLAVIPKETAVATVSFPGGLEDAARASVQMMRAGLPGLAALEVMDDTNMAIINKNGGTTKADGRSRRKWPEEVTLFLKFSGSDQTSIGADTKRVADIVKQFRGHKLEVATSQKEKDAIWAARKEALWAMLAQRDPGTELWATDVAVPLSRLAEIVEKSKSESSQLGLFNSVLGHVGDGNFHQSVMYHPDDPEETKRVKECVRNMMARAIGMGGTVSGEHAIGIGKKDALRYEVGEETLEVMRRLKKALDPLWIMNPGKVFDYSDTLVSKA